MHRREFIKLTAGAWLLARMPAAQAHTHAANDGWRGYRLTYSVELPQQGSDAHLWLPMPEDFVDYQHAAAAQWSSLADMAGPVRISNVPAFFAQWNVTAAARQATVSVEISTRDRIADFHSKRTSAQEANDATRYLQATPAMPLDGIVHSTALAATQGASSPLQKARAIYDWVVEHTFREPSVKGCGRGDIKGMLETGNLGGKCADINALFVGLCRAAGIPAREVYGIRVDESRLFKSLGRTGDISRAQHCRAEFYLADIGWIPVDPADVRKAVLEEKLPLDDTRIVSLREYLFGNWEMNWVAFNHERSIVFNPNHTASFFMYPCAEIAGQVSDSLAPDSFVYRIHASRIA